MKIDEHEQVQTINLVIKVNPDLKDLYQLSDHIRSLANFLDEWGKELEQWMGREEPTNDR